MDCYTLTGSVADRIQVHAIAAESDDFLSLDLFRPNGTLVSDGGSLICSEGSDFSLAVNLACPLDTAGAHTLIIEANNFTTNYSVSAQRSNNPSGCTAMTFGGGPSTGSFADAEMDCYTFSAAAGDQVRVHRFGALSATHVEALVFGPGRRSRQLFRRYRADVRDRHHRHLHDHRSRRSVPSGSKQVRTPLRSSD